MSEVTVEPITFVVPGQERTGPLSRARGAAEPLPAGLRQGRLKQSVAS